jgi:hypothetical protein
MAYGGEGSDASRQDVRDVSDQPSGGWETDADANAEAKTGWFRDPIKHHEHRFRDERGWTRRVSHFGVAGDDPYWPQPAWYRDPSRRFRYRYWDEDGWTARSSLGGSTTHDPVDAVWPPPSPFGAREDVDGLKERATAWSRSQSFHRAATPNIKPALGVVPAYVGHALRLPLEGGVWPYAPRRRRVD